MRTISTRSTPNVRKDRTPQLDPPVVPARHDEAVVELEAGHRVVVRAQPVLRLERREVKDDDSAVRSAGDEGVGDGVELELADEGGMALEEGEEFPATKALANAWRERKMTHPVVADQMRTVESRLPVATRIPSNATA